MLPVNTYEKIAECDLKKCSKIPDAILQDLSADQFYLVKSITMGTLAPVRDHKNWTIESFKQVRVQTNEVHSE